MVAAVETMAYVADRGTPWHGEGTSVEELMTAAEALQASGLDWEVEKRNLRVVGGEVYPDRWATVRTSDGKPLGIVGSRYQIIQNAKAFEFADNLVDSGEAKYETAGSLWGGRRIFLSMELAHLDIKVPGDESETNMKLLLVNGHDGGATLSAHITPVRAVCANTVNLAIGSAKSSFEMRHSGHIEGKLANARKVLGVSFKYAEDFAKLAEKLALKKVVDEQVLEILRTAVYPIDVEHASEERIAEHPSTLAFENYLHSETNDSIRGTAWGALNGIAEFIDYGVAYKGKTNDSGTVRTTSLMWGTARAKKQAALKALLKV